MASESDGSITIDTELDNTGFEKGSDKLLGAVRDLTGAVDTLGDNMMRSFSQVIPLLSDISSSVSSVNDRMAETATQTADANTRVIESEQQVSQVAQQAAQAVYQQGQSVSTLAASAASAQGSISSLEREVNALSTGMQGISRSAETGFANGNAVIAFESKLDAVESKLMDAQSKLAQFANTKIPTEDYQWLTATIQKTESAYDRLLDRQMKMNNAGVSSRSKSWSTLAADIELTQRKLAEYKSDLASLEHFGQAFTMGSNTEEYARMKTSVDETAAALERNRGLINSEALAQARLNVAAAQERIIRAETAAEQAAAQANLRAAQQALSDVAASMSTRGTASAPSENAISGWHRFGQVLKSAGNAAVKVVSTLAKASFAALGKGIKSAANSLKQFVSHSKKATITSNGLIRALTSIKTLLKTRIKRMFISAIINGVKESIQSLALFSSEFDKSMSSIKNSSKGLGANLSVALGGLINALAPIISTIINAISTAITYLNAFFALLGGKSTVVVAKKQTESYAASLKDAAGEAEGLKRQVYGFDQLNKRSADKDKGGGDDGKDLFENVDIDSLLPDTVRDFFDRIKAAFEAGDWYGIGMIIAEGLNTSMGIVDSWINSTLRPMGVLWAGRIAQMLNGLVDGFDWTLLGKTLADGINAVFDTLNTFLTTFNFENLGAGIGTAINGLFSNIEWDLIGQTFANKWNALINSIYGLVSTIDWSGIGLAASQLIDNFFSTIDLSKATASIGIAINGVVAAIQEVLANTDWMSIAVSMGEAINTAFSTINWGALGQMLITGINTAVGMIGEFIRTIDWSAIGSDIATFLNESVATIDWSAVGTTLGNAIGALLDLLMTLIGDTDWSALVQNIIGGVGEAIGSMDLLSKIAQLLLGVVFELVAQIPGIITGALGGVMDLLAGIFESLGCDSIAGFFKGLGDALRNVGTWLKQNLVDPVVTAVKELFGIHSPSTVFAEIGDNLISGLLEGIEKTWGAITKFFSGVLTTLKNTLSSAWNAIKSTATQAWNGIKSSLSSTWSSIKTAASTTWNNIKSTASTAWGSIKTTATTKWDEIKTSITTKWDGLKTTLSNTDWKSVGTSVCNGIRDGITNGWTWLKNSVSSLAERMLNAAKERLDINSPSRVFRDEVGKNIGLGVAEGISDTESDIIKTVSNLAQNTANAFDTDAVSLNIEGNAMVTGLDIVADKLAGIAGTFRSITDMLTSLGGLNMPQIAAGTVAPAKTRIDTSSSSNVTLTGFSDFTSGFDEYMAEQSGLLRQLIEIVRKLNLNIDVDSLSKMVTSAQKAQTHSFGGVY